MYSMDPSSPLYQTPTEMPGEPVYDYAALYPEWYGRAWVAAVPSHMPAYFNTTPQDGPGNQVFPISVHGVYQDPLRALSSSDVPRQDTTGGTSLQSTTPGGLTGNRDSTPYRNLRASRWTDALNPPA